MKTSCDLCINCYLTLRRLWAKHLHGIHKALGSNPSSANKEFEPYLGKPKSQGSLLVKNYTSWVRQGDKHL